MLAVFFEAKAEAAKAQRRLAGWAAWHAGVLSQSTKVPTLSEFLGEPVTPVRRQTPDEQWAIAQRWNQHLGGKALPKEG